LKKWILPPTIIFISGAMLLLGIVNAGNYLSSPADEPHKADLIVVLGGDAGSRSITGARLFTQDYAPRVLLTGLDDGEKEALPYYLHWRSLVLVARGVPKEVILYDLESANSQEEALNTLRLMVECSWNNVLVVSDPPHMRRLSGVWGEVFKGSNKKFSLIEAVPRWWNAERWWANEISGKFVINEYIKLGYYWVKY
jgi:uncharacterized SAM-binding protein YcdF (DUF218 family)